jgi:DnaJ-class molecular chaperone
MNDKIIICNECQGRGLIITPLEQSPPKLRWYYCKKCKGVGQLSWLENIFKKTKTTIEERRKKVENLQKYLRGEYR